MTTVLAENPFTKEFYEQELKAFQVPEFKGNRVEVKMHKLEGRLDGYLYKDFIFDYPEAPIFYIEDKVWMSVTPMEVESHYMPIECAFGIVGVGGLGLGYYTQRILAKDDVDQVIVYEANQDVIDIYLENFGQHPKLTIVNQDVLTVKDQYFDFFYCDIYQQGNDYKAIDDMKILLENNEIAEYHFWTMESFIYAMVTQGFGSRVPYTWQLKYYPFLKMLMQTKGNMVQSFADGAKTYEKFVEHNIFRMV